MELLAQGHINGKKKLGLQARYRSPWSLSLSSPSLSRLPLCPSPSAWRMLPSALLWLSHFFLLFFPFPHCGRVIDTACLYSHPCSLLNFLCSDFYSLKATGALQSETWWLFSVDHPAASEWLACSFLHTGPTPADLARQDPILLITALTPLAPCPPFTNSMPTLPNVLSTMIFVIYTFLKIGF